ncbi:GIY-YIG nuclease family protein [Candidatus Omnitrophota bacterium]
MDLKEKIRESPNSPGVYLFKDKSPNIIYVGKALSIRKRIRSHFAKDISGKQKMLIDSTEDIDYILTPDESTALLLEAALIKKYDPKYNVSLKDDKSYPRLKLTINEEYPRLFITRKLKDDGAIYFGPYTNSKLLRKAVEFMRRTFPLRTCRVMQKKECLDYHIGQCLGPCVDDSKRSECDKVVKELCLFLNGDREELLGLLVKEMKLASEAKDFELATRLRDRIKALSVVSQSAVGVKGSDSLGEEYLYSSAQLDELTSVIGLGKKPSVIEAFDISNISGKEAVGSMVYFKDGKPDGSQYRKFKIKTVNVIDDYRMMSEIVSRRYRHLLREGLPLPNLVIIDGGKGHLAAARRQIRKLGLLNLPVISVAKRPDKIYISEDKEPILLGKFRATLYLIQRIRDEAHRFAIEYHRVLRRKSAGVSELDNVRGIGQKRKQSLMRHFGSLKEIKTADIDDLKGVEFISEKEAKAIYNYFR